MSNVFSLDSLREETEKKYAPVKISLKDGTEVELKSLLRLGKKSRESVTAILADLSSIDDTDDTDELVGEEVDLVVESVAKILNIISASPAKILKDLDHPDPLIKVNLMTGVLNLWIGGTQLGEAQNSPV